MTFNLFLMLLGGWVVGAFTMRYLVRHRHTWRVAAVDHGVMNQPRRNATAILYVCPCGEAKSTVVAGTFEVDEIRQFSCVVSENEQTDRTTLTWSTTDKLFARSLKVKL